MFHVSRLLIHLVFMKERPGPLLAPWKISCSFKTLIPYVRGFPINTPICEHIKKLFIWKWMIVGTEFLK